VNFLLEIGSEEIPHWMIPGAVEQLRRIDLFGAKLQVDATPRRLVVRAAGMPERTPDEEQIIKGPPVSAGEKAATGFAKKQGVELAAIQKAGDYYEVHKYVPGRAVRDLLAGSLPGTILGLQWPKTMYWTGKNGAHSVTPRLRHGDEPSVRLQNADATPAAAAQLGEISIHERADVRVDERGRSALVFTEFRRNLVRGAKVVIAGESARGDLLVLRIRIGVQKADGNRLGSRAAQATFQSREFHA